MPAYIVSVRPLIRENTQAIPHAQATVHVLIRDPIFRNKTESEMPQELYRLTNADAHLAHALCAGAMTASYALKRRVSLNTVYSHLKRIREKTGCKSVPDLIRKFGELNVPLHPSTSVQRNAPPTRNTPPSKTTASRIAV